MVRSTFAVVAAAVAAPTEGKSAQAVTWTTIPPAPADGGDRFTNIWDDSAWATTSSPPAVTTLPSAATPLDAAADGEAAPTGPASAADPLTPVNHPTH